MYWIQEGEVEFIADPVTAPADDWYVHEFGGGVMLKLQNLAAVFVSDPRDDEELGSWAVAATPLTAQRPDGVAGQQ